MIQLLQNKSTYAVLIGSSYWMPFASSATPIRAKKDIYYLNVKHIKET